ncbi:hypothetical protein [Streptomyces sp. CAI-85]|uniref:hypothetical protein n=1 Tax=Streptomyces sp. CAI-85 TaxID=1472662 RepID=UPI001587677F|nr:hypothetical protein [Streptomyces sp. CAI-85]NUV64318.1 hypothetical protein [Streptomyces sp. CAI-85]
MPLPDPFPRDDEQLDDEPAAAFAAWRLYASVAPRFRDLGRVAELTGTDPDDVAMWAGSYGWDARTRAHDSRQADLYRDHFEQGRRRILDRLAYLREQSREQRGQEQRGES